LDYSQYKQIEFRRRFFQLFGATITLYTGASDKAIGCIKWKALRLKKDIRLFSDTTMQQEVMRVTARNLAGINLTYDAVDSTSGQSLFSLSHRGIRSAFKRDYWDIYDPRGNAFGAIKETSGTLAVARRWIILVPYIGIYLEAALAFTPQTFDILSTTNPTGPLLAARLVHRKNPFIVKMGLDNSVAQATMDARVGIAAAALLSVLDASKRN
jgi:hypothetical protein